MNKAITLLVAGLLTASLTIASAQESSRPQTSAESSRSETGAIRVEENVPFCNGLSLDVYEPTARSAHPRPAVILIHGGGWTSFDKSTMGGMARFLARFGFVGFAIDYRLFHGAENRWPAQLDDAQCAVRWVRAHAAKYSVNADRLGAFGHSAGAQLAALLGMEETRENSDPALANFSSKVQAVVDVSGPSDFTTNHDPAGDAFLTKFFGGSYAQNSDRWRGASPVFHAAKADAPFLIVHGTQDEDVPIAQSEELAQKLQAAGVPVSLVKVDDAHTFRTPEARRELAIQTLAFFNRYLPQP